jgi:hypothetical protein
VLAQLLDQFSPCELQLARMSVEGVHRGN